MNEIHHQLYVPVIMGWPNITLPEPHTADSIIPLISSKWTLTDVNTNNELVKVIRQFIILNQLP